VDNSHGTWQYLLPGDGGDEPALAGDTPAEAEEDWLDFGSPTEDDAVLLPAYDGVRVRFVPNPGFTGTVANGLRFRAWDVNLPGGLAEEGTLRADTTDNGGHSDF